jgi:hypothetical protein
MMLRQSAILIGMFLCAESLWASEQCIVKSVDTHNVRICHLDGGMLGHDHYALSVDGELIFALVDDYVEKIVLTHKVPQGLAIEMPLSKSSEPFVTISGGCVPVIKKDTIGGMEVDVEVARRCNFTWGATKIVDDVEFVIE